ncbi:MAG: response regulator [Gemmatimonadetes bacterium]|nr:response regulator [Gemmatimonadota bacterium]
MRLLLEEVLRACGHQPIAASDGTEAWAAFEREVPPMVILDWQMPGLDGLEVCRRIRAHPEGEITFVLMVTARDRADDLTAVLDAGADDYMSKPVTPDNLQARLRIAERRIALSRARRAAEEELRRARYLAGIGETTLALHHEINNPLAALLTHTSLIQSGIMGEGEVKESLSLIADQARRIAEVVKRLGEIEREERATSVEYLNEARMLDLRAEGGAAAPGKVR